jgi:hypothetical protein
MAESRRGGRSAKGSVAAWIEGSVFPLEGSVIPFDCGGGQTDAGLDRK